jgi:hypothetical protein
MPGRPTHKRKRDASENDRSRTKLGRKDEGEASGSARGCPTKKQDEGEASGSAWAVKTAGASGSARGGSAGVRTRGGVMIRDGVRIRGRFAKPRGGSASVGEESAMGRVFKSINGKAVRSRGRSYGSRASMYPGGIKPICFGVSWDPIDGEAMLGVRFSLIL